MDKSPTAPIKLSRAKPAAKGNTNFQSANASLARRPPSKHDHSRTSRAPRIPSSRGFLSCLSSGLLRSDRVGWAGFPRERSELVATLYLRLCVLGSRSTMCKFFSYERPVVFAPYLRMRLIAPRLTPIFFCGNSHTSFKTSAYQRLAVHWQLTPSQPLVTHIPSYCMGFSIHQLGSHGIWVHNPYSRITPTVHTLKTYSLEGRRA